MFLKLMDANSDTIETHFALGALYRRRGEVERSIRIHQNLLAREGAAARASGAGIACARAGLPARRPARSRGRAVARGERSPAAARERPRCASRRLRAPARVAAGARHVPRARAREGGARPLGGRSLLVRACRARNRSGRHSPLPEICYARRAARRRRPARRSVAGADRGAAIPARARA